MYASIVDNKNRNLHKRATPLEMGNTTEGFSQWWANLDQASKHLEVFRFRDLSPTPIP